MADACLGEGEYDALIRTRPTKLARPRVLGELKLVYGNWGRSLNSTSTAGVTTHIGGVQGMQCCEVMNEAHALGALRCELELYRSGEQVWCGPIRSISGDPDAGTGEILASDVSYWMSLRMFLHTLKPRGVDLATIFEAYVNYALRGEMPSWGVVEDGDPPLPNDDPGITVRPTPVGVKGDRTVYRKDLKVVASELEELSRTGVDWTVTNRTWWAGGMVIIDPVKGRVPLVLPGWLTDEHFRRQPRIRSTAESTVTDAWVRGNGVVGHVGGPDPQDGVLIQRVLDEYSIEDQGSADASAETYHDRAGEALTYVEGNNALEPAAPVQVQHLIPGVLVKTDLTGGGCVPARKRLRLESVSANFNEQGEEITVGLQPEGTSQDARGEG